MNREELIKVWAARIQKDGWVQNLLDRRYKRDKKTIRLNELARNKSRTPEEEREFDKLREKSIARIIKRIDKHGGSDLYAADYKISPEKWDLVNGNSTVLAQALGRLGGHARAKKLDENTRSALASWGGLARSNKLSAARRKEIARAAAKARWKKSAEDKN